MEYIQHLSKDKRLKKLVKGTKKPYRLKKRKNIHLHLCNSIMSQQLSTEVARTIRKRFLDLFDSKTPSPQQILAISPEKLRAIGLSSAKTSYVHNVARFAIERGLDHKHLGRLTNDEIVAYLTEIKGVGRWTAEMLLMFTLGREDVFSADDLGIQTAMIKLYKLDKTKKKELKEALIQLSGKWSPYRTYACMHLWHWKDNLAG